MDRKESFEQAARADRTSIVGEFWQFLGHNKKWWLLPIVLVLVACSLLAVAAATFAPSIYTLF